MAPFSMEKKDSIKVQLKGEGATKKGERWDPQPLTEKPKMTKVMNTLGALKIEKTIHVSLLFFG